MPHAYCRFSVSQARTEYLQGSTTPEDTNTWGSSPRRGWAGTSGATNPDQYIKHRCDSHRAQRWSLQSGCQGSQGVPQGQLKQTLPSQYRKPNWAEIPINPLLDQTISLNSNCTTRLNQSWRSKYHNDRDNEADHSNKAHRKTTQTHGQSNTTGQAFASRWIMHGTTPHHRIEVDIQTGHINDLMPLAQEHIKSRKTRLSLNQFTQAIDRTVDPRQKPKRFSSNSPKRWRTVSHGIHNQNEHDQYTHSSHDFTGRSY